MKTNSLSVALDDASAGKGDKRCLTDDACPGNRAVMLPMTSPLSLGKW